MAPTDVDDEFEPVYHRYTPHRAGLPPLVPYFRELWARREFAAEMSKASLRSSNVNTVFGQLWLILNPMLLAGVYYLLVTIIRQRHDPALFTHLVLALFAFTMVQSAASTGATSVTGSGRLLINTAFPRLLIPLSAVRTAFWRFLPTIPIYLLFHIIVGLTWHPRMMISLYFLATMVVFSMGLSALFATCQVYFRDTSSFLPYFLRLWMYLSPVLWLPEMLARMGPATKIIVELNPMYPMLTGYAQLLQGGQTPPPWMWAAAAGWALGASLVGFLFFIGREREFAVRLT
ncbi:putative ABC transporter permease protein [Microlunatus phosphovorus NM-1]|uniref:Putative ABC transporter permease protein n=1 Tax=Microlunatus phosphovorus (strain ATCC 700054 / DSM 10555 / JCM 9379 / NBRC 101784 / NCIMB 13414 / VKM Ac-1990 / NM-1) TaxID=1032480 RepID=F5XIM7_MICPN|nr:ABC transporter permease [Microlunatus phosphovorus]BAK38265.1 putative ABC transporter permease protein [Microlunatus phosphovorus NM-1]